MTTPIHEFTVAMTCEGCSGAVERVLGKLKGQGVEKVDIDLPNQKVFVESTLPSDELLETIKKTGKAVTYVGVKSMLVEDHFRYLKMSIT